MFLPAGRSAVEDATVETTTARQKYAAPLLKYERYAQRDAVRRSQMARDAKAVFSV